MVVVVAEMIAVKSGLGYKIQISRQLLEIDFVVAYMVMIGGVGAALSWSVSLLQKLLMPYLFVSEKKDDVFVRAITNSNVNSSKDDQISNLSNAPLAPSIHFIDVGFSFDGETDPLFSDINIKLEPGEILGVVGMSGTGKTSLLRLVSGSYLPNQGVITINSLPQAETKSTWVTQDDTLFAWMSVYENLIFGLEENDVTPDKVEEALRSVGLFDFSLRYPKYLSGGQRQRVQLARAILSRKSLLLLDEPFSAIDALNRVRLLPLFRSLIKNQPATCFFVTHDLNDAVSLSDRILVLGRKNTDKNVVVVGDIKVSRDKMGIASGQTVDQIRSRLFDLLS
jgi:sulfonate transport system ATP-binding protein